MGHIVYKNIITVIGLTSLVLAREGLNSEIRMPPHEAFHGGGGGGSKTAFQSVTSGNESSDEQSIDPLKVNSNDEKEQGSAPIHAEPFLHSQDPTKEIILEGAQPIQASPLDFKRLEKIVFGYPHSYYTFHLHPILASDQVCVFMPKSEDGHVSLQTYKGSPVLSWVGFRMNFMKEIQFLFDHPIRYFFIDETVPLSIPCYRTALKDLSFERYKEGRDAFWSTLSEQPLTLPLERLLGDHYVLLDRTRYDPMTDDQRVYEVTDVAPLHKTTYTGYSDHCFERCYHVMFKVLEKFYGSDYVINRIPEIDDQVNVKAVRLALIAFIQGCFGMEAKAIEARDLEEKAPLAETVATPYPEGEEQVFQTDAAFAQEPQPIIPTSAATLIEEPSESLSTAPFSCEPLEHLASTVTPALSDEERIFEGISPQDRIIPPGVQRRPTAVILKIIENFFMVEFGMDMPRTMDEYDDIDDEKIDVFYDKRPVNSAERNEWFNILENKKRIIQPNAFEMQRKNEIEQELCSLEQRIAQYNAPLLKILDEEQGDIFNPLHTPEHESSLRTPFDYLTRTRPLELRLYHLLQDYDKVTHPGYKRTMWVHLTKPLTEEEKAIKQKLEEKKEHLIQENKRTTILLFEEEKNLHVIEPFHMTTDGLLAWGTDTTPQYDEYFEKGVRLGQKIKIIEDKLHYLTRA